VTLMNRTCSVTSPFANHRTCPLVNHVHCFVTLNCSLGAIEGTKTQASIDPPFDRAMILFHYVVQIGNDSAVTPSAESTLLFQFINNGRI
jgi:hypothetical protein